MTLVNRKLAVSGSQADVSNMEAPTLPEVTGGPGSLIPWEKQSREPGRWLREALTPDQINAVMGEPAKQPIRVYAPLTGADAERNAPTCCWPRSTAPARSSDRPSPCSPPPARATSTTWPPRPSST